MHIIGVDPGANGALALLSHGDFVCVLDMPTRMEKVGRHNRKRIIPEQLAAQIKALKAAAGGMINELVIEKVAATPRDGASGAFTFGLSAGLVKGAAAATPVPFSEVTPQTWKKALKLGRDKSHSIELAKALYPAAASYLTRKKDDGRAEAILIAHWRQQVELKNAQR